MNDYIYLLYILFIYLFLLPKLKLNVNISQTCHCHNVLQLRKAWDKDYKVFCSALCCPFVVINQTYSLLLETQMTIFEYRKIRHSETVTIFRGFAASF